MAFPSSAVADPRKVDRQLGVVSRSISPVYGERVLIILKAERGDKFADAVAQAQKVLDTGVLSKP